MSSVLKKHVDGCKEPLDAQAVRNVLYGLHKISSEWVEVRDMLIALKNHVDGCKAQ